MSADASSAALGAAGACAVAPGSLVLAPSVRTPSKVMIDSLTGLRAVAAFWVVIGHFRPHLCEVFPFFAFITPYSDAGYLGVDLFFALSGFVLAHNYLTQFKTVEPRAYGQFLWLRLARLYPVHLFTLLVLLAGVTLASVSAVKLTMPGRFTATDFMQNLMLVHAWGFSDHISWNGPAWSISAEWFAYLLFPFMAVAIIRMNSTRLIWSAIGASYLAMLVLVSHLSPTIDHLATTAALARIITQFTAGCLIYRLYMLGWGQGLRWSWLPWVVLGSVLLFAWAAPRHSLHYLLPAPLFGVLLLGLCRSKGLIVRFLSTRPMLFWGEVSYSLYMTHDIIRLIGNKLLPVSAYSSAGFTTRAAVVGTYAFLICGTAIGTYLLVEKPSRDALRRAFRPTRTVPPVTPVTPAPPSPSLRKAA
jgi:peptidoglycan/LPS O-acetylase OafA/YrhL